MGGAEFGHAVCPRAALSPDDEEIAHQPHGRQNQQGGQQQLQPVGGFRRRVVVGGDDAHTVLQLHQVVQIVVKELEIIEPVADRFAAVQLLMQRKRQSVVGLDGEILHLLLVKELPHLRVVQLGGAGFLLPEPADAGQDNQRQENKAEIGHAVLPGQFRSLLWG